MRFTAPRLALAATLLTGCARGNAAPVNALDVAVLLSGGRGDNGFNDAAIAGAERAARDFGVKVHFVDPAADGEAAMARGAARLGANLVIGVGFQFTEPIQSVAASFPHTRFVGIDMQYLVDSSGALRPLPDNVAGIAFREDEGAFLVGALAAMSSPSHTVGFVGGMPTDVIKRFEDGYRSGVRNVCPECRILVDYVGSTPAAFSAPERGQLLATAQFSNGADVVFHAAGRSGQGVIDAAAHEHRLAIGADIDESVRAPGYVLTSMQKSVDVAIYEAIRRAREGRLEMATLTTLGLAQDGVGYVYNERNRALITPAMHARVEQLRANIVNGRLATRQPMMESPTM